MDGRRSVARSGLTSAAVAALTPMMMNVEFDQLGEVKRLLKQYFSEEKWGQAEEDSLAAAVGAGEGELRESLSPDLRLIAGWQDGRFRIDVETTGGAASD